MTVYLTYGRIFRVQPGFHVIDGGIVIQVVDTSGDDGTYVNYELFLDLSEPVLVFTRERPLSPCYVLVVLLFQVECIPVIFKLFLRGLICLLLLLVYLPHGDL